MLSGLVSGSAGYSGNDFSWKKLWFSVKESIANPTYGLWGTPITGTFASGEVIAGAISGATGRLLDWGADADYYGPGGPRYTSKFLMYTPITGTFAPTETVTGQGSGAIMPFDFGPFPVLADDTQRIWLTHTPSQGVIVFSNSGYAGIKAIDRPLLGTTDLLSGLSLSSDFIFQLVFDSIVLDTEFTIKFGALNAGKDVLRLKEDEYALGIINATLDTNIAGATTTPGQFSSALVRRNNQFNRYVDTTLSDVWKNISASNLVQNAFQNRFGVEVSTTPSNSRLYGYLLAVFPRGLPPLNQVETGLAYHKTQWLAGNKVLTTAW